MLNSLNNNTNIRENEGGKKILIPTIVLCVYQILSIWSVWLPEAQAADNGSMTKNMQTKEFQNKWKSEINFMNDILNNKIRPDKENQDKWIKSKRFLINNLYSVKKEVQHTIFIQILKADDIMKIEYFF